LCIIASEINLLNIDGIPKRFKDMHGIVNRAIIEAETKIPKSSVHAQQGNKSLGSTSTR
jgi:hypothetical protein